MADDVFSGDESTVTVLDELVGEDRKFKTVEDLAKGKKAADDHIAKVERENAEMKAKLEELMKSGNQAEVLSDLVDKIKNTETKGSEGETTKHSQEELIEIVKSVMKEDKEHDTRATNRQKGNELVLKIADGNVEAARALVAERAQELGMSPAKLAELSETSPSAFAALIGGDKGTATQSQSTSALPKHNTEGMDTSRPMELDGFKTKAWFDAKRKEMGHVKYINDQQIQREFAKSMNGLGERFNN